MDFRVALGRAFRAQMARAGVTHASVLAAKVGTSDQSIGRYLSGTVAVPLEVALAMADALGTDLAAVTEEAQAIMAAEKTGR